MQQSVLKLIFKAELGQHQKGYRRLGLITNYHIAALGEYLLSLCSNHIHFNHFYVKH